MSKQEGYVIVTGATGAIGAEIAAALCQKGHNLILPCRNMRKAEALVEKLKAQNPAASILPVQCDFSSSQSVADCADALKGYRIEGLINNAGVMNRDFTLAPDGMEMTIAINYQNTADFTRRIIEIMKPHGGKIVFTSSLTRFLHRKGKKMGAINAENYSQLGVYGLSKRLITDFAKELSQTLSPSFTVNCADPGVVDSGMITMHRWFDPLADLLFRPFIRTPRKGAQPAVRAFEASTSGGIYCRRAVHKL